MGLPYPLANLGLHLRVAVAVASAFQVIGGVPGNPRYETRLLLKFEVYFSTAIERGSVRQRFRHG